MSDEYGKSYPSYMMDTLSVSVGGQRFRQILRLNLSQVYTGSCVACSGLLNEQKCSFLTDDQPNAKKLNLGKCLKRCMEEKSVDRLLQRRSTTC